MKHPLAGLALGLVLQPLTALASSEPSTQRFTLDNGLRVIVHEDHRAAVVHSQLWYRVGSSYEPPGQSGLSHALEHMVFKAAANSARRSPTTSFKAWASPTMRRRKAMPHFFFKPCHPTPWRSHLK